MDYRTIKAGKLLEMVLRGRGFDTTSYSMTVKEKEQYADLLNAVVRSGWEAEFWPQLILVERRQYRPDWAEAGNYEVGNEVYYATTDAYYRALAVNIGITPGSDAAVWEEADEMVCFVEFAQPFGDGSDIDETGLDYEAAVYEDDPLITPDAVAIAGCRPWQRSILVPSALAPKRPYVRFRASCPSYSFTEWSGAEDYATGDLAFLTSTSESYVALQPSTNKSPDTEAEYWAPVGVPAFLQDYIRWGMISELAADDEGKYKTQAKAEGELERLKVRHLPAAGLGGRARFRYARGVAMALAVMLAGTARADGARNPGDYYAGGGSGTNAPYQRAIVVYGSVETNDLVVFADRTGRSVRGTNVTALVVGAVQSMVNASNALDRAYAAALVDAEMIARTNATAGLSAAIVAYSNLVGATYYPRANPSNWVDRAGATQGMQVVGAYLTAEADLKGLAAVSTQRTDFVGGTWAGPIATGLTLGNGSSAATLGATNYFIGPNGEYSFAGTTVAAIASRPIAYAWSALVAYSNALYSIGGQSDGIPSTNTVYRYDGAAWQADASLPTNSEGGAAFVLGDYLYYAGGNDGVSVTYSNVWRFDGTVWTNAAPLPAERYNPAGVSLGQYGYVMGGESEGDGITEPPGYLSRTNAWRFDGASWTEVAGLPVSATTMSAGTDGNYIYCAGSRYAYEDLPTASTNAWRFDGSVWEPITTMPSIADPFYTAGSMLGSRFIVADTGAGTLYSYSPAVAVLDAVHADRADSATSLDPASAAAFATAAQGARADAAITNNQAGATITRLSMTLTNSTAFADGVLNGTNGVYFVPAGSTNRYWILGGN